ncbi:serine/threonine-protein kinase [Mastigocladopsis repens]|uniref:serine/threonine-protein kinase n=1 Tax=Mastigocladopsis repens TaxID=221287 RepID=UPI001E351530|nr:serine/threonine-protein kinase [Mastigocladopsis repens]
MINNSNKVQLSGYTVSVMMSQTIGGRYRIIQQIGKGGFAVTFIAEDTQRPGNPQCVIKQFKPIATDEKTLQAGKTLFVQEAQTLEQLGNHDQIPRLLAHFEENQEFYLVQEFIEGHDLNEEMLPGKPLSEAFVVQLLQDILEVLAFVHQQGVIHCDIKPSNIRRRLSDGKIVLIDFGAVNQISTQVVNSQGETTFTLAIGTRGYMPSEQANGNPKFSSDIYALGIICIQALTGIHPDSQEGGELTTYPADTTYPTTGEIIWRDRAQVSPQLANILDKMVCYDFRERYYSANEALQAIKELSSTSPLKKALIGVGIATSVALLIAFFYQFYKLREPKHNINFLSYENSQYDIKIKYAEGWIKQEQGDFFGEVAEFFPTDKNLSHSCPLEMAIRINDLPKKLLSLEEYKNLAVKKIKNNNPSTHITDESSPTTTLSNFRAYKLIYTRQDGKCHLRVMETGTVRHNKAYYITYTAESSQYSNFLPIAEKMINSFQILKND